MNCREFRRKHDAYIDDTLSGVSDARVIIAPAVTVTFAVALLPPVVAVTVADPGATPVITPTSFTVTMLVGLVLQMIVCPDTDAPEASFGVALSWAV